MTGGTAGMAGVAGVAGTATAVAVALVLTRARPPRAVGTDHAGTDPEPDLVDVLDRLGRDLRSGVGVTAAVTAALRDAPSLLPDVSHALAHQVTLASALDRQQPIGDEAALVLHALRLGAAHPPTMALVLARTADAVRERRAWRYERRVQAAQARASARVLTALPLVFAAWGVTTSDDVRHTLATSTVTVAVLAVGLALNGLGWLWMRRLVVGR